ncbi:thermonuclease family protein [Methanothermobacter thermautotrophicus]|nr:thermonuclease family protein [Methanothermobacter thermautotrophicus]
MKRYIVIVMLALMVAGCVSEDGNYTSEGLQDSNPDSSVNDAGDSQGEVNGTAEKESSYEASGYCYHVVDGDTIDVEGVGRIRLVGVNTPERGEPGYREATDFVKSMCLGRTVQLDIDDAKRNDKYGRVLAVVYVDGVNLNRELLRRGYAEVMYIPPSEFNPYGWTS